MKKILFSALILFSFSSNGQISVILNDLLQVGDTITRYADTMTSQNPGPSGSSQNWVMDTASTHLTLVTKGIAPSATPYASSYASSNIAMTNDNLSYLFANQNSASSVITGAAGDLLLSGCLINTPFVPDILLHNFPRTYQSNFSDAYGLDVTIDASCVNQPTFDKIRYKRVSTVYDTADGWGIITTPVGKYQCLRIKRTDFSVDSTWVKPFFPPSWVLFTTKKDTSYSYSWITKEGKLAIAELANDSLDKPKRFTWSQIAPFSASLSSVSGTSCGLCNGAATLEATGLYQPFSYNWPDGQTTDAVTGLCDGNFLVTVSDNIGNSKIVSVSVQSSSALTVSPVINNASSFSTPDGSAEIMVTGGTPPYQYLWENGNDSSTLTGLLPGNYLFTVTDASGCSLNDSVEIGSGNLSLKELKNETTIIFPVPVKNQLSFRNVEAGDEAQIFDAWGKTVEKIILEKNTGWINVSEYKGGFYLLIVKRKGTIISLEKFITE